jgi:hypothetical protein
MILKNSIHVRSFHQIAALSKLDDVDLHIWKPEHVPRAHRPMFAGLRVMRCIIRAIAHQSSVITSDDKLRYNTVFGSLLPPFK